MEMRETPKRQKQKHDQLSFEKALARLEEIAARLETGELPLEQAIALAEEGQRLIQLCEKQLTEAAGKIQQLVERAGLVSLEPLETDEDEPDEQD
jgi:exodeoxyribonuclease VII small subunit